MKLKLTELLKKLRKVEERDPYAGFETEAEVIAAIKRS